MTKIAEIPGQVEGSLKGWLRLEPMHHVVDAVAINVRNKEETAK